jgi:hypothetical protein
LNAAFADVITFEKLAVLRYEVKLLQQGPCCDNNTPRGCSDPGKLNYISATTWVQAVVNDAPFDSAIVDLVQQLTLYPGQNSPALSGTILNVFLWDW